MNKVEIPDYSVKEEIINSSSHGIGAILSIIGFVLMIKKSLLQNNSLGFLTSIIFGGTLFILYLTSCLYHGIPKKYKAKKLMRVIDHCNVFILEAGTFTPVCLLLLGGKIGWIYFTIIWLLTILGIILNFIDVDKYENFSLVLHLGMGWSIILVFNKLISSLNISGLRCLFGGGLLYTIGAFLYYLGSTKKYMHSVFHFFCLAGSFAHFLLVYLFLL